MCKVIYNGNNKFYTKVINTFGHKWILECWNDFKEKRNLFDKKSLNKEIVSLEINLHPLLKEIFKFQDLQDVNINFDKIPDKSIADISLKYLGRDLILMENELNMRGNKIINDLKQNGNYYNHRFNLLVASGYKQLKYEVEFIPSSSKKGKTPDLLVKKDNIPFCIECKQRDQYKSDKERFGLLAEISEDIFDFLRSFNNMFLCINIKLTKGENNINSSEIIKIIKQHIAKGDRRKIELKESGIVVDFSDIRHNQNLSSFLRDAGHLDSNIVFTSAEDYFFSSDPNTKNSIFVNKNIGEIVPLSIYSSLDDANEKKVGDSKLFVYFDLGNGFTEWGDSIISNVVNEWKNSSDKYNNIAGLCVIQTLPRIMLGGNITIQPNTKFVCSLSKLGVSSIEEKEFFGGQGETGIDQYLDLS